MMNIIPKGVKIKYIHLAVIAILFSKSAGT